MTDIPPTRRRCPRSGGSRCPSSSRRSAPARGTSVRRPSSASSSRPSMSPWGSASRDRRRHLRLDACPRARLPAGGARSRPSGSTRSAAGSRPGEPLDWRGILGVVLREKDRQIPWMAAILVLVFLFWAFFAHMLFALFMGLCALTNISPSGRPPAHPHGLTMVAVRSPVGAALAFVRVLAHGGERCRCCSTARSISSPR